MKQPGRGGENGFSLIELVVAMSITLVVSGAIYGLIAGGQTAFRREPERSDRQQNIRVAMDLILRDVASAGVGMPAFIQTFTPGLDACAGCPDGGAPMGPDADLTDELEMITNTGARDNEPVCHTPGGSTSVLARLVRGSMDLQSPLLVLLITEDGSWTLREVVIDSTSQTGAGNCEAGQDHTQLDFNPGLDQTGLDRPAGICAPNGWGDAPDPCTVTEISFATIVRYRIRNDADGVPVLQRWASDSIMGFDGAGGAADAGFQTLARGIEDLQVEYLRADGDPADPASWQAGAPDVVGGDFNSLISQVRVTLSARSEAQNVQGMTTAASARTALRGRLTATGSPRATLLALSNQTPSPLWR